MNTHQFLLAGDSWAWKAYTDHNYNNSQLLPTDQRFADFWNIDYQTCITPGLGNLDILSRISAMKIPINHPIVWVYTEPGRDYAAITGRPPFEWMVSENIFHIRANLHTEILQRIKQALPNPIALIGGLSDIDQTLAQDLGFYVLHSSWQRYISEKLDSQWFQLGWGASDIGWRMHADNVTPGRTATFAWDEQIKEWCWWEDQGWFCHEHPNVKAHREFAEFLEPSMKQWLHSL
jgi:hypothetical protein